MSVTTHILLPMALLTRSDHSPIAFFFHLSPRLSAKHRYKTLQPVFFPVSRALPLITAAFTTSPSHYFFRFMIPLRSDTCHLHSVIVIKNRFRSLRTITFSFVAFLHQSITHAILDPLFSDHGFPSLQKTNTRFLSSINSVSSLLRLKLLQNGNMMIL